MQATATLVVLLAGAVAAPASSGAVSFRAHGSVKQVYVTGLRARERVALVNRAGHTVQTDRADSLGGLLFRNVAPGRGYRVRPLRRGPQSGALTVLSTASRPPTTAIYNQSIASNGYQYVTTRDGTKLAIDVHPPSGASTGPTPTVFEYSGYGYADPAGPQSGIAALANLMGFTVVDVNMRGTGCSGGAYDFFEPLQNLDGYDLIEMIARQPWVLHHKVGMIGVSYGGISQLFTAQTDPPSLAAISPLSVIDSTQTTLYPGGILNTGFAFSWAKERVRDARPASPSGGQSWAYERIQQGDATCKANQGLHGEAVNLIAKVRANNHYVPALADPLAPVTFVDRIKVPVYMACQWTDEQTGGHCADLAEHFTRTHRKWFTFTNGTHIDSLDPRTLDRWCDFLQLYVAQEAPATGCAPIHAAAPLIYQTLMRAQSETIPPDPIQAIPAYPVALSSFERIPSIRIMFDNGAGGQTPGYPDPGFEQSWSRFPVPGTKARFWYLRAGGVLTRAIPTGVSANTFTWNARARSWTDFVGNPESGSNGLWTAAPLYNWQQPPTGSAASYLTSPLSSNTTVIGAGAVHLWVRSSTANVDLQATITEVRPDGKETFVQSGWVRANERKLDRRKSTLLEPVLSLRASDVQSMPPRRYVEVTVPLYYEGHVYRAGSRIRVIITAPNGDQPIWSFSHTFPRGPATVSIAHSRRMPSNVVLPVVPGVNVPTRLPPCPGLRGEPCRAYQPYAKSSAAR